MAVNEHHIRTVLEPRGISAIVYNAVGPDGRPRYTSVTDYAGLKALHTHPMPWYSRLFDECPSALLIARWSLAGDSLPSYLRFDRKVILDPKKLDPKTGRPKTNHYVYPAPRKNERGPDGLVIKPHVKISAAIYSDDDVKVLDVHPLAVPLLRSGPLEEVYLCSEGCFKADALLSQGKAVLSIPSVTMWNVAPTHLFPYLAILKTAKTVWIVPDSDYLRRGYDNNRRPRYINPSVRWHTDKFVYTLRGLKVPAEFCVPPFLHAPNLNGFTKNEGLKIGIDDLLGKVGGNLEYWNAETNPLGVHRFTYNAYRGEIPPLEGEYSASLKRDGEFIAYLTSFAGSEDGLYNVQDAGRDLGWNRQRVLRTRKSCERRGILETWPGKAIRIPGAGYATEASVFRFKITLGLPYTRFHELVPDSAKCPEMTRKGQPCRGHVWQSRLCWYHFLERANTPSEQEEQPENVAL